MGKTATIGHRKTHRLRRNLAVSPTQVDLHGICYGKDRFMAVGQANAFRNLCQVGHSISGIVTTEGGTGIQGVQVSLSGASSKVNHTGLDRTFSFTSLADGTYTVTPPRTPGLRSTPRASPFPSARTWRASPSSRRRP